MDSRNCFNHDNGKDRPISSEWLWHGIRYLKGDRLFPGNASMVAPTGLGTVDVVNGNTAISAAEAGNLEAGVGEVIEDGAVKPAPPTLRARIVGQGYKQASRILCKALKFWNKHSPESLHKTKKINLRLQHVCSYLALVRGLTGGQSLVAGVWTGGCLGGWCCA